MPQKITVTDDPYQQQYVSIDSGENVLIRLRYIDQQYGWVFEEITYGTLTIKNLWLCCAPNMLRQWKDLIPFGLACKVDGFREPTQLEDFATGAASLYLLNADDVQEYEAKLQV